MMTPSRIQRKRTKGWRLPPNTISVTRPGAFGNPFAVQDVIEDGFAKSQEEAAKFVVQCFDQWLSGNEKGQPWWWGQASDWERMAIIRRLPELRGKNLACFCREGAPCHADVLLTLANKEPS